MGVQICARSSDEIVTTAEDFSTSGEARMTSETDFPSRGAHPQGVTLLFRSPA